MKKYFFIFIILYYSQDAFTQNKSLFKADSNSIKSKGNITLGFWPLVAAFSWPDSNGARLNRVTLGGKVSLGYYFINHLDTKILYEYNVNFDNRFGPLSHQSVSFSNQYIFLNKKISPYLGFAPRLLTLKYKSYPNLIFYNDPVNQMNTHHIFLITEKIGASFIFKKKFMFYAGLEFLQPINKNRISLTPPFIFDFNFSLHRKIRK